jgi:uncharacterized membrane protein
VKAPTDRLGYAFVVVGVAALGLFALSSMTSLGLVVCALMGFAGVHQLIVGRAAVRTHAALQAISRGQIE